MSDPILHRREGNALYVTLNNPKKGNSLNVDLIVLLNDIITKAATDDSVMAIVLTGAGKYFCTGMDLSSSSSLVENISGKQDRAQTQSERFDQLLQLFKAVEYSPKPVIALINGPCYGGGTGLAFACDIRVSLTKASFVLSEVKRGLTPAIISPYIVREWGPSLAREAMIQARTVQTQELYNKGALHYLVNTVEEGEAQVARLLENQRHCAPFAVAECKRMVRNTLEATSNEARDAEIKKLFLTFIKPSEEAAWGFKQFQAGNRNPDWAAWAASKSSSKL